MTTLLQIKNILGRKFRGANIDDVQGTSDYTLFEEAANNLISHIDPIETVRTSELSLYNEIYDYASPSDLKGKKILDIRPQGRRNGVDFRSTFTEDFDRDKEYENEWFSVEFDEATKFLRINKDVSNSLPVTDTVTTNYTAGTGVSNIAEDTVLRLTDASSLRFDASSGQNLLTFAGTAVGLSAHELKASFFTEVYYPDSSLITSLKVRVGSSSANYYEITGVIHRGSIRTGINLYRFDWNGATETGTVDIESIDYVRYELTTTGADTDIRIGKLSSKLPSLYEIKYYSNALFRPLSGSTWLTKPTAETDILNLETEAQNLFMYECCVLIADGLQYEAETQKYRAHLGIDGLGQMTGTGLYGNYKKDKPSEAIRPSSRYYTPFNRRRYGFK
jgi:hypothetical protein